MVQARAESKIGVCPKCGSDNIGNAGVAGSGNPRYRCRDCGHRTTQLQQEDITPTEFQTTLPESKIYVITAAQNATPVHKPFFNALEMYCDHMGAELVISGYRYRNPTSQWTKGNKDAEWWAKATEPYLYQTREAINENLEFMGDVFAQPTAVKPLSGFETITGERSCIIPHPKVQLRTVATPAHKYPKILTSTGTCTIENYTESKAGKVGAFHHTFGAVVVEVGAEGQYSMRQISAQKNGAFYDLTKEEGVIKVDPKTGITTGHKLAGLVMGDFHADYADEGVIDATFGESSIVSIGDPTWLVWHDLIDMYSRKRFDGDPFLEVGKYRDGLDSVYEELVRGWKLHDELSGDKKSAIINSNHTNARMQWYMNETDWRKDPANAEFYLETALQLIRSLRKSDHGHSYDDPFVYWGKQLSKAKNVQFPELDTPFRIAGIECGFHGHIGPGAARVASLDNMRRIGTKTVFGHTHTPGTEEGAMSAGTSTRLRLGYNSGPSAWMTSHIAIFPNGKRTHLFIMNGEW